MRYLENILGIRDVKDTQSHIIDTQRRLFDIHSDTQRRHFENQTDLMCKALAQIAVMRSEIEKFRTEFDHFSAEQAWGQNPHNKENGRHHSLNKKKASSQSHKESGCTLEKENTQYKAIVTFLRSRKQATTQQIYHAVKGIISTQNKDGKRGAVYSALSRLRHHGFVKKVSYGVYQIKGES